MEAQEQKMLSDELILYTVQDIKKIFSCGSTQAYALMSAKCFPSFRINKKLYVSKPVLEEWIKKNTGKSLIIS